MSGSVECSLNFLGKLHFLPLQITISFAKWPSNYHSWQLIHFKLSLRSSDWWLRLCHITLFFNNPNGQFLTYGVCCKERIDSLGAYYKQSGSLGLTVILPNFHRFLFGLWLPINFVVIVLFPYIFRAHYNVFLKDIEVGGEVLTLPSDVFENGFRQGTIIDSGTTLAYLPQVVYETLVPKVRDFPKLTFIWGVYFRFLCVSNSHFVSINHSDYGSAVRIETTYCWRPV